MTSNRNLCQSPIISSGMISTYKLDTVVETNTNMPALETCQNWCIILMNHENKTKSFTFNTKVITVGRHKTCDIILTGNSVSNSHFQIERYYDTIILYDLSRNGTCVNGNAIQKKITINHNDLIKISNGYTFTFIDCRLVTNNYTIKKFIKRQINCLIFKVKNIHNKNEYKMKMIEILPNVVELGILKKLNHQNIIRLIDHFDDYYRKSYCMIFENTTQTLKDKIHKTNLLKMNQCKHIINTLMHALHYLKTHKIIKKNINCNTIELCQSVWKCMYLFL